MSQTKAQLISDLVQALNFTGTASAPANGLFLSAANTLKLATASTERLKIDGTEVVVNDTGASVDFRIEGDTDANLFKVDASADRVGIGTASPATLLEVSGDTPILRVTGTSSTPARLDLTSAGVVKWSLLSNDVSSALTIEKDDTAQFTVDTSGNVGIGTTSPSTNLHVKGPDGSAPKITLSEGTPESAIRSTASGTSSDLRLMTSVSGSQTTKLIVDYAGKVGIGNTSPQGELHIGVASNANHEAMIILNNGGASGQEAGIEFRYESGTTPRAKIHVNASDKILRFSTDNEERMRIDNNGRIIVGGTSAGTYHQDGDNLNIFSTGNTGLTVFSGTSSLGSLFFADDNNDVHGQRRGAIQYNHNGNTLAFWTNAGPKMTIDSSGRLLIGITSARENFGNNTSGVQQHIQLEGTSAITSSMSLIRNSNDVNDGGIIVGKTRGTSVGSNTAVQAGDDLGNISFVGADGTTMQFGADIKAEVESGVGDDDMPAALVFSTNGGTTSTTERMRIDSSGHVGINDTSPSVTLDITGEGGGNGEVHVKRTSGASCFIQAQSATAVFGSTSNHKVQLKSNGTTALTIDTSQRIGIGTTSPAEELVVRADAPSIQLESSNASGRNYGFQANNDGKFHIYDGTAGVNRLTMDSSGRLLAGSTSTANNGRIQGFIDHGSTAGESGITSVDSNDSAAGVGGEISFYGKTNDAGQYNYLGHVRGIKENGTSADTACALTFHTRPTLTAPQERMRIKSTGHVSLISGNLEFASGSGVDFSAVSDGTRSVASNILDDYEEGSWTPAFGNVTVGQYGTQYGRYCKVGSQVMLVGQITVDSGLDTTDGSGINIGGLPFSGNSAADVCHVTLGRFTSILKQTTLDGFTNVRFGGNFVMLMEGNNDDLNYTNCNSSGTLQFAISYITNT